MKDPLILKLKQIVNIMCSFNKTSEKTNTNMIIIIYYSFNKFFQINFNSYQ